MNILLVAECEKKALVETRRILDQFAERRGQRTWQTAITHEGLLTLRKLLRQTARKNTAVACHWIRAANHTELLWVVGDASRFNAQGAVPTQRTHNHILRQQDEDHWQTGEDLYLLTGLAALLHDLGKACQAFQERLKTTGTVPAANLYRHEWVSLRLWQAFVGEQSDQTWLTKLAQPDSYDANAWLSGLARDGLDPEPSAPFESLAQAPFARAIAWLIVTHHRLPQLPDGDNPKHAALSGKQYKELLVGALNQMQSSWNQPLVTTSSAATKGPRQQDDIKKYWTFKQGLPTASKLWRERAARLARRALTLLVQPAKHQAAAWLDNPFVMHLARLNLMLADHYYSSLTDAQHRDRCAVLAKLNQPAYQPHRPGQDRLAANTLPGGQCKQSLDEHLIGVAAISGQLSQSLPRLLQALPRLAGVKALRQRSADPAYRWQDKAFAAASALRSRSLEQGAFIINMASTGCGKTLGNARIMYALADPQHGMRCTFATGLRTLTLQTGRAFRQALHLADDELAIRVGEAANTQLFEYHESQAEQTGSASAQTLSEPSEGYVDYSADTPIDHPLLRCLKHDPAIHRLLHAPLLVCTIDHLTPATECQRGGRQIAPMLRLLSSDLVLDELDDFGLDDLPALTRLVHWAGLLGARVLLSSATLPPALVRGLFLAYQHGRAQWARNCTTKPSADIAAANFSIACLWVDETTQQTQACADKEAFSQAHSQFVAQRCQHLQQASQQPCRRVQLVDLPLHNLPHAQHPHAVAQAILQSALVLHQHHAQPVPSLAQVSGATRHASFGLVRMANIQPLYEVAQAFYSAALPVPADVRIHLCVYHAQFPLMLRSHIEHILDSILRRQQPQACFTHPAVRQALSTGPELQHLFIVLASPVAEVGRDHDYDWAIVEPSSMRSLIQLAGRVKRHRKQERCTQPNIHLLAENLRVFQRQPTEPAYWRPGFEDPNRLFEHTHLSHLLEPHEYAFADARPRIQLSVPETELQPTKRWVDAEHVRIRAAMLPSTIRCNAADWWHQPQATLSAILPRYQPFRRPSGPQEELFWLPHSDTGELELYRVPRATPTQQAALKRALGSQDLAEKVGSDQIIYLSDDSVQAERIQAWPPLDPVAILTNLAESLNLSLIDCARRFSRVKVRSRGSPNATTHRRWVYHPQLGFALNPEES